MFDKENLIKSNLTKPKQAAWRFIFFLGFVSLWADITYEGARSILGPYFAMLGASGTTVGIVAGLGEFIGYALRFVSGLYVDKTKKYWPTTIAGYVINLFAVPLLALAASWPLAAILVIIERAGKAIRTPARDAMLSHAANAVGSGVGFGIHKALDQIGAFSGPLLVTAILYFQGGYRKSFAILIVPAIIGIILLMVTKLQNPEPKNLEIENPDFKTTDIPTVFWIYLAASCLIAIGFTDFPLIAFHFEKANVLAPIWIPIFYGIAMAVSAITALAIGYLYDRIGIIVLISVVIISAPFPLLVFFGGFSQALIGMVIWGVGIGSQQSLMRAVIGNIISKEKRATAYGIFNAGFGMAWFIGSSIMGILYDTSLDALVVFSIVTQLMAIPFIYKIKNKTSLTRHSS